MTNLRINLVLKNIHLLKNVYLNGEYLLPGADVQPIQSKKIQSTPLCFRLFKYYFIKNIAVYQGRKKNNIDVSPSIQKLHYTHKSVENVIIKSGIENDP